MKTYCAVKALIIVEYASHFGLIIYCKLTRRNVCGLCQYADNFYFAVLRIIHLVEICIGTV